MENFKSIIYSALKPYSALLFLDNRYAGLILLLITFLNPSVAISGILSVVFSILFAEFLEFKEKYLAQGFYVYNSLLVGMGIGYIFSPSLMSIALIAIMSSFTFMLSFMLNRLFSLYKIPILSLPFSLMTMFVYLASLKYSGLLSTLVNNTTLYDIELPLVFGAFFKSFGTIFFLPLHTAGLAMFLLVLYFSRITAIMALVGFYTGVGIHSFLLGSFTQALYDPYAFNYILVAIALCGVFLLPTLKNFILALMGVAMSVVLTDAIGILFNYYAIPVFTLPFNITVIIFIFMLSLIYYKEFNITIKATPEESLANYLSRIFRFGDMGVKIALPFSGEWSVYQAFKGEWTHKGEYQYAYDFVKKRDEKSYKNQGLYVHDYYAFGESVLSPVSGYIVAMRQDLVDNIIGEVDTINNWGNYIIIKSDLGFFVEISHLMQYSLSVEVGTYVQANTIIAKCGNSGYSPEPHIHIQVQDLGVIGAFTRTFTFSEGLQDNKLHFNLLPKEGESVSSVLLNKSISSRFLYILDDIFKFEVFEKGKKLEDVCFTVKMDEYSAFYLEDEAKNRLYFFNDSKTFCFYDYKGEESHLKWLFILAPRTPFIATKGVEYVDFLPVYLLKSRFKQILIELAATVHKEVYQMPCRYTFDSKKIVSDYGEVHLSATHKGHTYIKYNNIELKLIQG
ncbi:Peptidase, M23/M37 family [hydrothermal vent metagenome]|uniref:Peptidase, M23/M37 family n=1 Tax=hydrothermal vent metagenome TaxID=652676 RepID=A0A1W1CEN9_9ZZZZ